MLSGPVTCTHSILIDTDKVVITNLFYTPHQGDIVIISHADGKMPKWLTLDAENLKGTVVAMPQRDDIDVIIEEHLIVEFYSR